MGRKSSQDKSFLIVVTNRTSRMFSIKGPMWNDTNITNRVVTAQVAGAEINCHNPGTLDKGTVAAWAQQQGLTEVPDATRTEDLKGPWDVVSPDGQKVGTLQNAGNFDLWFTTRVAWARVEGESVVENGRHVGSLRRDGDRIVYHAGRHV